MRILSWLLRAFIFFTLFAFALNNLHTVTVHWFFGVEWRSQMVFVVLAAFSAGCTVGVLSMMPGWLRKRSATQDRPAAGNSGEPASGPTAAPPVAVDYAANASSKVGV